MAARIYLPAKTATSSGRAKARYWILEMEPTTAKSIDPLCGWSGSGDTSLQVQLKFPSREAAIAYAKRNGLDATVSPAKTRMVRPKSYADNFTRDR